jgi:hypothetical protein
MVSKEPLAADLAGPPIHAPFRVSGKYPDTTARTFFFATIKPPTYQGGVPRVAFFVFLGGARPVPRRLSGRIYRWNLARFPRLGECISFLPPSGALSFSIRPLTPEHFSAQLGPMEQCPVDPEMAEAYLFPNIPAEEARVFEEHYLACPLCTAILEETSRYLLAMEQAAQRIRDSRCPLINREITETDLLQSLDLCF